MAKKGKKFKIFGKKCLSNNDLFFHFILLETNIIEFKNFFFIFHFFNLLNFSKLEIKNFPKNFMFGNYLFCAHIIYMY